MSKTSSTDAPAGGPPLRDAPDLSYQPPRPTRAGSKIGLIGCGGISSWHLKAYRKSGYQVAAFCDIDHARAENQRDEFYPDAVVYTDYVELLRRDDIEVVDIATHPHVRPPQLDAALRAGKHVLSQKPFVEDLDTGHRLVDLADEQGVLLAVNQNARWAPHWSYLRQAVGQQLLGTISGLHFDVHWDHGWVTGTAFEHVRHLILYDFAIHWFDIVSCLMDDRTPRRVTASFERSSTQTARPSLLAEAMIEYDGAQASLVFDGDTKFGHWETTFVAGDRGSVRCEGPDSKVQRLTLDTVEGTARPQLEGSWFPDGFCGTMGELLSAIEENRQPSHNARNNLDSLALCFAAVASAERGEPVVPGTVRSLSAATVAS
jgi:predicted dehydrogenase